ncbi:MAG TPA: hypothetical protein PLB21_00495 [Actinomycetota bacterium]|nr:hypothetical protein [Actinomycetota bacterium]
MEKQPTQMRCPRRPESDNSTHHMVNRSTGNMVCSYCGKTRAKILKEAQS